MDHYLAAIKADQTLRPLSIKQYCSNLRALVKRVGHDIRWCITHPAATVRALDRMVKDGEIKPETRRAYVSAMVVLFQKGDVEEELHGYYQLWKDHFVDVSAEATAAAKRNVPTEAQRKAHVPFEEIVAMRESLPDGSIEQVLLAMYTMIPPARADYGEVRIYDHRPSDAEQAETPNYMIITTRGKCTLVLNEYKTVGAYGTHKQVLPAELAAIVRESLRNQPRQWLFLTPMGRAPFRDGDAFSEYVRSVLSRLFDRPASINTIRHAYANSLNINKLTTEQLEKAAHGMMHSVTTLLNYRKQF